MSPGTVILLAVSDGSGVLEVVIWLVAGAIWLASQMAAARKRKERRQEGDTPRTIGAGSSGGLPGAGSPAPDELAEIFKRLGADIPATPPPSPRRPPAAPVSATRHPPAASPPPDPARAATSPRPTSARPQETRVQPDIARRLARVKREAAEAARQAEAARHLPAFQEVHGIVVSAQDSQSTTQATRTSGLVLPRLHAMDLRLSRFPSIPMPGFHQTHRVAPPLRIHLRNRRELRDAIVAQALLHPPRSESRI